jgi:hypothetical protein
MSIDSKSTERERFQLLMLRYVYEAGVVDVFEGYVREWPDELRSSVSHDSRDEFAWFEREAEKRVAIEAEHGKESLLNLDHRFVKASMTVTPSEREAARRHRVEAAA